MSDARLPFRSRRRRANTSTANRLFFVLCCFGYLLLGHLPLHCNQQRRLLFNPSNLNDTNQSNDNDFSFFLFVQALEENSTEHQSTDSPSKKKRKITSQSLRTKQQARRKNLVAKANSNNTQNSSKLKDLFVRAAIRGVGGGLPGG